MRENQTMRKRFNVSKNRSIYFMQVNFTAFSRLGVGRVGLYADGFIQG